MYRRLQDDNLRMQQELETTIYNLKAKVSEFEQNGKVASLNPNQQNCNLPHFDNVKPELLQLRVSFYNIFCFHLLTLVVLIFGRSSLLSWGN